MTEEVKKKSQDYQFALERARAIAANMKKEKTVHPPPPMKSTKPGNEDQAEDKNATSAKRYREDEFNGEAAPAAADKNAPFVYTSTEHAGSYSYQPTGDYDHQSSSQPYANKRQNVDEYSRPTSASSYPDQQEQTVFTVPQSKVGLIIGRRGETLRSIEGATNTKVQLGPEQPGVNERTISILGPPDRAAEAKRMILDKADQGRDGRDGRAMAPGESIEVRVPASKVGLVIGRQASTLKDIQSRTGARVYVVPDDSHSSPERVVQISGSPEAIQSAKEMVEHIAAGGFGHPNEGPGQGGYHQGGGRDRGRESSTIEIPSDHVGLLIGKGGETIKSIQHSCDCKVQIDQNAGGPMRRITIMGTPENIPYCKQMISERLGIPIDGAGDPYAGAVGGGGGYGAGASGYGGGYDYNAYYGQQQQQGAGGYDYSAYYGQQQQGADAYKDYYAQSAGGSTTGQPTDGQSADPSSQQYYDYYQNYYQQYYQNYGGQSTDHASGSAHGKSS